jgi:hypothetical protein
MAQAFQSNLTNNQGSNPGRVAFGVFKESQTAGDYLNNKKARTIFCRPNLCKANKRVGSQENLLLLRTSNYLNYYACSSLFNPLNLNSNLLSTLDLKDVPVIKSNIPPYETPAQIDLIKNPYLDYIIDPKGLLFGNTPCGINNYLNYRVYNKPYNNPSPDYIDSI